MIVGIFLGVLVGAISSLLSLGGSIILVPTIPTFTSLSLKQAVPLSIFIVNIVTAQNSYFYYKTKLIDLDFIKKTFLPLSLLSFISAYFSPYVSKKFCLILLLIVFILMAVRLLKTTSLELPKSRKKVVLSIAILISGSLSGLIGMGNGLVLAPCLLAFNLMPHQKISPTINLSIFLGGIFSLMGFISNGHLINLITDNIHLIITITLTSMASSHFGRKLNSKISQEWRKKVTLILIVTMFIQTLMKVIN
jgi:uncharacterized protein